MKGTLDTPSILIIYTGGTIGMVEDRRTGALENYDFAHVRRWIPELDEFDYNIESYAFKPAIDSSDMEPANWAAIVKVIADSYEKYDGFVILHGTDTMAYSASALSFMIEGLTKPVIFTGSQLPVGVARTDGKENLISAVEIAAAKDSSGHAMVPEVCICFGNMLMRGNRTTKVSSESFRAFRSENLPPLAEAGISIRYNTGIIMRPSDWSRRPVFHKSLDTRVSILKLHPGITPGVVRNILCGEGTRAVIIETYGSGNATSRQWFLDMVRESVSMGKIIVNVTQCLAGSVNMDLYATGKKLEEAGVKSGYDSSTEGMLAKLFFLMGKSESNTEVIRQLDENLRGEITK